MADPNPAHDILAATIHQVLTKKVPNMDVGLMASVANNAAREIEQRFEVQVKLSDKG